MSRSKRLLPTVLAIGGFATILIYAFMQLGQIQRSIEVKVGENMLWVISQAERETRRVSEGLLGMAAGQESYDELLLRLDILYSRFELLSERPQAEWFEKFGAMPAIVENRKALDRLAVVIENPNASGEVDLNAAREILLPMLQELGRITNLTMIADRLEKGLQQERTRKNLYLMLVAFVGLLLAGGLLSWQLLVSTRAARHAREELQEHKAELERIVAERTAKLNAALETERYTKEIYRSFITTVSHQFRTPLSIIDMIAQRLIRRPDEFSGAAMVEKAQRIRTSTQRLTQLIGSVTNAARMDDGQLTLSRSRRDLNMLVRAANDYHVEIIPHRMIELRLSSEPLFCDCDPSLIEQVVLNLLSNAVKYSNSDKKVEIRTWREDGRVFCQVQDSGIGIPVDDQPRIFERFFRASNASSIVGSGLGLSLSQTMIQLHGGRLFFASVPGLGTTATFSLPADGSEPAS